MLHFPKTIRKALIVYKKSSYQTHALDERDRNYLRLLRENNVATRRSLSIHGRHVRTFELVKKSLRQLGIRFDVRLRYHLEPIKGYDLIITVGGDGTFLDTSHYVEEGLLLGVNSVPVESIGWFCHAHSGNFREKIKSLLRGALTIRSLHRLETTIDGRRNLPLALNDVLFTNQSPAGTTRYLIKARHHSEEQKSSGVWISPAPGSTAAVQSAGGWVLPLTSEKFQYVVREPYEPPGRRYHLKRGILEHRQTITLASMMDDASLYIDGPHRVFPVRRGSEITIRNAHRPILAVW